MSITNFQTSWRRLSAAILGSFLVFQIVLNGTALAASASFGVNPVSASIQSGSNISVTITIAAGSASITAAQACVVYDSSKITLVGSPDYSSSALNSTTPSDPTTDCGAGQVQLGRFGLGVQPTGTFTLGAVTFKAVAASGTTPLSFSADSFIIDNQGDPLSGVNGGSTITITAIPSQTPAPTQSSSSGSSGGAAATVTTKPTAPTTKPAPTADKPAETQASPDSTTIPAMSGQAVATTAKSTEAAKDTNPPSHIKLYIGIGGLTTLILASAGSLIWFKPPFLKKLWP